jgi:alpha-glucuronidase
LNRREFVTTSVAGVAGLYAGRTLDARELWQRAPADEDGYKLWLRYAPPGPIVSQYKQTIRQIVVQGTSPTAAIIRKELSGALSSMFGPGVAIPTSAAVSVANAIVVGTPDSSPAIRSLGWTNELNAAGPDGFVIRRAAVNERRVIAIASAGELGALYGTFHFLRLLQTAQSIDRLNVMEHPKVTLRMINHWDNLNGTIERGYAGRSLWQWNDLPGTIDPRYTDYARTMASIGLNGAVVNNVNAQIDFLTPAFIAKEAALANVWRPYGVRLYLSVNFAAPVTLGKLTTADPLDATVAAWWKAKADEIYAAIPDFGGFLVKANSEGQPGPKDYKRTHAEGANVMADALAPHGGSVIWRAFVYDDDVDPDRAKRAYIEFTKLDGQFKPNVLIQVKNGTIDFQPREPFHPLFGAMKHTPVLAEIQATQEYLGQAKHLVYLGTMWEEFLESDTYAKGQGSTVAKAIEGAIEPYSVTGFVSVANPGSDRNWCGHHFSQSNWYASGRLAWNPQLTAAQIADEWTRMTFTNDAQTLATITALMMGSRETYVNYTMPLGLHHMIGGNHYAPMPENAGGPRKDWTAVYYHQASAEGIGFDRTMKGDQAVAQYFPPVRDMFDSLATCPEKYLLWFHRLPWTYKLKNGQTLWDGLVTHYYKGTADVTKMQATWQSLAGRIDAQRHREVADRLQIQVTDAALWRDHILKYFQQFSQMPIVPPAQG